MNRLHYNYDSIKSKSTPVYKGSKIVGRDFPDGSRLRLSGKPGNFSYTLFLVNGTLMQGSGYQNKAAASRVGCMVFKRLVKGR